MGVNFHYNKYLYLNIFLKNNRKKKAQTENGENNKFYYNYLFIIIIYSIIMTVFSTFGKSSNLNLNNLIIIPIVGQMLHFYLDSQLWKFSIKHNRENVLKYILQLIN